MREFDGLQRGRRRIKTALLTAVALFMFGTGFTAAGGVETVKRWCGVRIELLDPSGDPSKTQVWDTADGDVKFEFDSRGPAADDDAAARKRP